MLTPVRALAFACLLVLSAPGAAHASLDLPDTSSLHFLGFRAGARLNELAARLGHLGGGPLRCRQSKTDRRVHECRAILNDQELGRSGSLWISAMDSVAGVMTVSAVVAPSQLERWRETLEGRYGRVKTRVQGVQSMLQWVQRGRMLRLTWRLERGQRVASVSLVDGHVLDGWGRSRAQPASQAALTHPASRTR